MGSRGILRKKCSCEFSHEVHTDCTRWRKITLNTHNQRHGTVEIVIVSIALSTGVIDQELFSILVFTAIFTTTLVSPTVKWGIDWLEQTDELVFIENVDVEGD